MSPFSKRLDALVESGLLREELLPEAGQLVFCSNDYLGFANDPRLVAAFAEGLHLHGAGSGASRLVSGAHSAHQAAENALAKLVERPAALLFSTGYAANVSILPAVAEEGDLFLSDELNHASLIDGIRLSRAIARVIPHRDVRAFKRALQQAKPTQRVWIVTDAVFSMSGAAAPLQALSELAQLRPNTYLYVDEAHSIGIRGEGRGLCHELGIQPEVLLGTLGKAFGLSGAFVAGSPELRDFLYTRARGFVFSTASSPAHAHAVQAATELVLHAHEERERVRSHAERLRRGIRALGWETTDADSPIVPLIVGGNDAALHLQNELMRRGLFVRAIRPPTVPKNTARLRLVPTAAHSSDDIDKLLKALGELR